MELKVDPVLERELIKPASSSPRDHLQLSIFDLTSPAVYVSTVFFYKAEEFVNDSPEIISGELQTSLSETLSRFYPLAGRIVGVSINCNDEGVVFSSGSTDLLLSDFLSNLNTDSLEGFLPKIVPGDSPSEWPLLSVKVTFFGSRSGFAVAVSASHRICDISSLLTLVTDWASSTAKGKSSDAAANTLQFAGRTIYPPPPPTHISIMDPPSTDHNFNTTKKFVKNRFVFESSKIAELKRKAASASVPVPTRVEAVSSLIWRSARNASRSNLAVPRSTMMYQAMDLRPRIPSTVLSQEAFGNIQTAFLLKKDTESELELPEIVATFRKVKEEYNEMIKENLQTNTLGQTLLSVMNNFVSEYKPDIDIYSMSSWCRKSFYEVDFGWGRPIWMCSAMHTIYDNMVYVVLIDSKDGEGVEAWITLLEEDMSVFVRDQDLLAYAVLNPPVLI